MQNIIDIPDSHQSCLEKLNNFLLKLRANILNYHASPARVIMVPLFHYQESYNIKQLQYQLINPKAIQLNCMTINSVVRILQIIELCRTNLSQQQGNTVEHKSHIVEHKSNIAEHKSNTPKLITKRNLYYRLAHYYHDYSTIDQDIKIICQSLKITRRQLTIVASNRCIIFGKFTLYADNVKYRDIEDSPNLITVPTCSEIQVTQLSSKRIILVQKESMFFQFVSALKTHNIHDYLMVTAKGYPDQITRSLLYSLLDKIDTIFYFGDYDVFGFDIFLFYAFGDWNCQGLLPKITMINIMNDCQQIFAHASLKHDLQRFDHQDIKKHKRQQIVNILKQTNRTLQRQTR